MIPLLMQLFGPAIAALFENLVKRAKAGWQVSTMKASASVVAIEGLAHGMGCDVGLLEPAIMALPAALLLIFEVPSNMIMPTVLEAMRTAVEQKRKSNAVLADAQAQQDEAAKKFNILPVVLLMGLLSGCSAAQIQKTEAVIVKLKADAQRVAIVGCQNLPLVDLTIDTVLPLLPPGTTIDQIDKGWQVAEPKIREFCARVEQQVLQNIQPSMP